MSLENEGKRKYMQKYAITSLIMATIAIPAMATNDLVTETNNGCDNAILNTYDGDVNLTANWSANTINLTWYDNSAANGGTAMNVGQSSAQCTYDGGITLPQEPTKPGYTFKGWRVRASRCLRYTEEEVAIDSEHLRWKPLVNTGQTMSDVEGFTDNSADLEPGEWAIEFSSGELKGMSKCSNKYGNNHGTTWPIGSINDWRASYEELTTLQDENAYCWCSVTDFGDDCHIDSPWWIYGEALTAQADTCPNLCAIICLEYALGPMRQTMFNTMK